MTAVVQYLTLAVAIGALLTSVYVAIRAGRWRESDGARKMAADIADIDSRLITVEANMANVATKADITGLQAEVRGIETQIRGVDAAVSRIEGHLMGVR